MSKHRRVAEIWTAPIGMVKFVYRDSSVRFYFPSPSSILRLERFLASVKE